MGSLAINISKKFFNNRLLPAIGNSLNQSIDLLIGYPIKPGIPLVNQDRYCNIKNNRSGKKFKQIFEEVFQSKFCFILFEVKEIIL